MAKSTEERTDEAGLKAQLESLRSLKERRAALAQEVHHLGGLLSSNVDMPRSEREVRKARLRRPQAETELDQVELDIDEKEMELAPRLEADKRRRTHIEDRSRLKDVESLLAGLKQLAPVNLRIKDNEDGRSAKALATIYNGVYWPELLTKDSRLDDLEKWVRTERARLQGEG